MSTTTIPTTTTAAGDTARPNISSPNPLRRGLSGLRRLGSPTPAEALRLSPRNYFFRSANSSSTSPSRTPSSAAFDIADPVEHRPLSNPEPRGILAGPSEDVQTSIRSQARNSVQPTTFEALASSVDALTWSGDAPMASTRTRLRASATARVSAMDPLNADSPRRERMPASANGEQGNRVDAQDDGAMEEMADERHRPPTICLFPHQDVRQARPSLTFAPIIRTLPSESSVIRVGRYSEREGIPVANPSKPSDAPVGFKSKVVSRKHCEFSFVDGSWQIKDVSSSSGTFLNHIRLSQPNTESRLYPVKDGDLVQLGIDFRGGEEMIFRCVKIRIECNRSWQKRPNHFNIKRHAQLRMLGEAGHQVDENKGECSICLGEVAPCQSLFIAACAHVWHYKCIRRMLMGNNYPQFTCPNCRAITDLEAELDIEQDPEWDLVRDEPSAEQHHTGGPRAERPQHARLQEQDQMDGRSDGTPPAEPGDIDLTNIIFDDHATADRTAGQDRDSAYLPRRTSSYAAMVGMEFVDAADEAGQPTNGTDGASTRALRGPSPSSAEMITGEGPLTPRNNAGPIVFDGSAGRMGDR